MFKLRLAEEKDIKNLFDLSNDKTVRKNSINKEKIKWYEHVEWFNNRLHKKEPFYIVEDEKENFIGQVRFDNKNDETVISISLVEKYRGKGLASKILKEAVEKSEIKNITAYIYENNHSSIKSFEKAGFKKCSLLKFEYKFNSPEPHNDRGGGKNTAIFTTKYEIILKYLVSVKNFYLFKKDFLGLNIFKCLCTESFNYGVNI